jgi:hypothetical protein
MTKEVAYGSALSCCRGAESWPAGFCWACAATACAATASSDRMTGNRTDEGPASLLLCTAGSIVHLAPACAMTLLSLHVAVHNHDQFNSC